MENVKYLVKLVVGEQWPLLVVGMTVMLILAYTNCFITKTGKLFYRRGKGSFIFLSSVAGCFHCNDLLREWIKGNLTLVEETAVENPNSAVALSVLIAVLLGAAVGIIFYAVAWMVVLRRAEFIERRYRLSHWRSF